MTEPVGLMRAVERDDQKKLQQLLSVVREKQNVSQLAKCLHMASLWGHLDCVNILVEAGALVNVHDINGNTPLIVAVRQDHPKIVKTLIGAKCNVNKATYLAHATPLHYAVSNGSLTCAQLLVDAGADIEAQTSSGRTPLMVACRSGQESALLLLLKAGAKVDKTDNDRAVALHFAAEENNTECIRHLLNAGANSNLVTRYGDSALGVAARKGNVDAMEPLLDQTGGSDHRRCNMSPLHWASEEGHLPCVRLLLSRQSVNVNLVTKQRYSRGEIFANKGVTPLMLASRGGYRSVVELLLDYNADVDKMDCDGMTALLYAVKNNNSGCAESLLCAKACENGVPPSPGGIAISPLLMAISTRSISVIRVLLRANCATNEAGLLRLEGDPILPIVLASQQQEEDVVQILQLFAAADCQNHNTAQYIFHLFETNCLESGDILRDLLSSMSVSSAPSLMNLCRHYIRCSIRGGLFYKVRLLPIPTSLQRFLLMNELEDEI